MATTNPFHHTYADVRGNQVVVGCYDIGIGKAVVFDGGAFTDPDVLRKVVDALTQGIAWLEAERETAECPLCRGGGCFDCGDTGRVSF